MTSCMPLAAWSDAPGVGGRRRRGLWSGRAAYSSSCIIHFRFAVVVQGPAGWGDGGAGAPDGCGAGGAGDAPGVPCGRWVLMPPLGKGGAPCVVGVAWGRGEAVPAGGTSGMKRATTRARQWRSVSAGSAPALAGGMR
jgi:hypothetical protein